MTTLLAVDDSTTMRKVIEITFAGEDFETVLASSANEAMERLYQASPNVALVDVAIGNDDGYELCQRIKGELPQTRVLLVSSKHNPFDAARAAAVGADDHIDKPFDTQSMIDKVRELASATAAAPAQAAPPIQPAPAPIQPAAPSSRGISAGPPPTPAPSEPPVLEPEAPMMVEPEELEAVTIEPPAQDSAPPAAVVPSAPAMPAVASSPAPLAASGRNGHAMETRLGELGLTPEQIQGVLALSKEVVEQAVWEVVPTLAEALIKEEIARLTK